MKKVVVITVVITAFGLVKKDIEKWIQKLDLGITVEMLQSIVYLEH